MNSKSSLCETLCHLCGSLCDKKSYTELHRVPTVSHRVKYIFVSILLFGSTSFAQQKVNWNGYLQYRFSDNYLNQTNFSVRRAKFWVNGLLPTDEGNWSYKLQANFLQQVKFQFLLQDVLVSYKINMFEVTAGQFVPDFSLQRKQPDYSIPLDERADVVNALVPGSETMARDIGVELKFDDSKTGSFAFGFFNGNGANAVSNNRNFLFVNRELLDCQDAPRCILIVIQNLQDLISPQSQSGNHFR